MGLYLTQKFDKGNNIVYPHFIYHVKNHPRKKLFTYLSCSTNHWNMEKKRVERGDKDYKIKNLTIESFRTKLESVINRFKSHDEILTPQRLILELKKREFVKESLSFTTLPLLHLIQSWEKEYMLASEIQRTTKSKTKSVVKDIKDYIVEVEKKSSTLMIDNLDDTFCRNFMSWLFEKPTLLGVGLQPHSVSRRFQYLQSFCKWYSDNSKEYKRIKIPRELTQSTRISDGEEPICLYNSELQKLFEFNEFDFYTSKEIKEGDKKKIIWVESDKWEKHLTRDRQNRSKKSGVVEFFYDDTKDGLRTYTTWEVYKDFLVFLSSVGCRFSDGVKIKLGDFVHKKRSETSHLKDGVEGFFRFYQKKTNQIATPRANEVSFDIYRKYSNGKSNEDFLFPRTERGNPFSDVKFNKHIKKICKTIGLKRRITVRTLGSKGVEVNRVEKYLWEEVSSHIGRKTYIKTMILGKHFSTQEIMKMTGHKSERVFNKYYSIEERDLMLKPNSPFIKKQSNYLLNSKEDVDEIEVDLPTPPQNQLTLKEKIIQLKELVEIGELSQKEFEERKKSLILDL